MTQLESWQSSEQKTFGPGQQSDAGLSRSVQSFYQPIERSPNQENLPWALDFGTGANLYQSAAYTGERLSARALMMTDEVEQKLDAPKIQPPSDAVARPSVIRTKEDEAIWDKMPHKLGKHESATHIGLSPEVIAEMQSKGQGSKLELFDSKAEEALAAAQEPPKEQTLIASNITPGLPNIEQRQQYQNIQSDTNVTAPESILAKNLREHALGTDIVRVAMPSGATDRAIFPYRGSEDLRLAECTKANPAAWKDAFESFPDLQQYLSKHDGTRLMQALVRNELHNYDVKDRFGDTMSKHGNAEPGETLGYSQISPNGVKEFCQKYPQLREYLASKGYDGKNAEAAALRDPSCIPMIVAAKLQSEVDTLKTAHDKLHPDKPVDINWRTLAYTYNADVYYNPKTPDSPDFHASIYPKAKEMEHLRGYEKAYPTSDGLVLSNSEHLKNVEQQLRFLR